jgi:lipoprotein-anchoring transpeptidase ErfK/SrfK
MPVPFEARSEPRWISSWGAAIHREASTRSPAIGQLERGSVVQLLGCTPSCADLQGWGWIEPLGAVRLSELASQAPEGAPPSSSTYLYGHVRVDGTAVRAAPRASARVLRREPADHALAFLPDPELLARGWLESPSGGFLPASSVRLAGPSSDFQGVHEPPPVLAFFLRPAALSPPTVPPVPVERHAALPVLGAAPRGHILVEGGTAPRSAVRVAFRRARPAAIAAGQRWVHIDLKEQTLTAYEGDQEVFATLVSTGKPGFATPPGIYRVWSKIRHATMNGRREPYHVEEVPDVMFFHGSDALHGAFWHDAFGSPITHGCVNLSPRDADWLFAWAPPAIPAAWHAVLPQAGDDALVVVIERGGWSGPPTTPQPAVAGDRVSARAEPAPAGSPQP